METQNPSTRHAPPYATRRLAVSFLTICAFIGAFAVPRPIVHASGASGAVSTGVVSLGLDRQVGRLEQRARHFLRDQAALPSVPIRLTSSRDVAVDVRRLGGTVHVDVGGHILEGSIPASQVDALAQIPGVQTVFPAERLHAHLDQSVPEIRADQVWSLTGPSGIPLQGQHVIVGILDSGVDIHNPDFRNPDGTTRILSLWDQTTPGTPPHGFSFGNECTSASINAGTCTEKDTDGHGTHVAGIAAGNGRSSTPAREIGVAPRADLIVVKSDPEFSNAVAAWQYMIARAQALGEPIVINNSFGGTETPHDGSSPVSLAADRLSGPGRIFVASAGNSGNKGEHADDTVHQGGTSVFDFTASGEQSEVDLSLFSSSQDILSVSLTNLATGQTWGPISGNASLDNANSTNQTIKVSIDAGDFDASHHETDVSIVSNTSENVGGHYRLTVHGDQVGATGRADVWMQEDGAAGFDRPDESDTLNDPGDGHTVIDVGNYATRVSWQGADNVRHDVCDFYACLNGALAVGDIKASSSRGPTADGRQKPDIAAPGTMIISSRSADAAVCSSSSTGSCVDSAFITPDGKNVVDTGTSMSAPHVTGVVALMLQADPALDPAGALDILRSTARHDSFTGTAAWSPAFGAGKVDALAAVQAALSRAPAATEATSTATATATPMLSPTPSPTPSSMAAPPPDFTVSRVVLHSTGKTSSSVVTRARVGTTVHVFVYWTLRGKPSGVKPSYTLTAGLRGKTVWKTSFVGSRPSYPPGSYWATYPFKVPATGVYRVTGGVKVATTVHTRTVTLTGVKK